MFGPSSGRKMAIPTCWLGSAVFSPALYILPSGFSFSEELRRSSC